MIETVEVGAIVVATDGEVGTVESVLPGATTGSASVLVVRTVDGRLVEIPASLVGAGTTAREVRLTVGRVAVVETGITSAEGQDLATVGDRIVVPVREEVLVATTRPIELGAVRIHKRVETVPYETLVDLTRDDVSVERVTLNQDVNAVPSPRQEGDTLVIPVVEEVVVTEKRLVLREEIRVTRRQVTESIPVQDTVRREVVEIEDPSGALSRVRGSALSAASAGTTGTSDPRA